MSGKPGMGATFESPLTRWMELNPRAWAGWPSTTAFDIELDLERVRRFRSIVPKRLIDRGMSDDRAYVKITLAAAVARTLHRRQYRKGIGEGAY